MTNRKINWINSPVLMEAMIRYEEHRLSKPLELWIEKLLEINPRNGSSLLPKPKRI